MEKNEIENFTREHFARLSEVEGKLMKYSLVSGRPSNAELLALSKDIEKLHKEKTHIMLEIKTAYPAKKEKLEKFKIVYDKRTKTATKDFEQLSERLESDNKISSSLMESDAYIAYNYEQKGNQLLESAARSISNVLQTDNDTKKELYKQGELLDYIEDKLDDSETLVNRSYNVTRNMVRRVFTNKIVLVAILLLLASLNMIIFISKIRGKL